MPTQDDALVDWPSSPLHQGLAKIKENLTMPNFKTIFPLYSGVTLMMGTPHVWQKYLCRSASDWLTPVSIVTGGQYLPTGVPLIVSGSCHAYLK